MRIGPAAPGRPSSPSAGSPPPRPARSFTAVLGERAGPGARPPAETRDARPAPKAEAEAAARPPTKTAVRALLERVVTSENRVDALLQAAAQGKTFSPAELLAMQASVFRYSQTVEIVSRVADRLVGAVKQTIGTQV